VTRIGDPTPGAPPHHRTRGFANPNPAFQLHDPWTRVRFLVSRHWASLTDPPLVDLPRVPNDGRALREVRHGATITWVGHSTFLIQLDGSNILTDPHWSPRASPFSFVGPRRLTAPGLRFEDLPPIHVVVISHDHYDHLDAPTVARLAAAHRPLFLVPLGLRAWFSDHGLGPVEELDWWDGRTVRGLTITCMPVQHWSGRSLWETNRRLWCGWSLAGPARRLFFAGDTGHYDGFRQIGARLGPFDLALVSIGAYMPPQIMGLTHTTPEEAIQVFRDVQAGRLVAMHWGTFNLAEEPFDEPPRRLARAAQQLGIDDDRIWVLPFGETRRW
jgi:N-acyl-phosphatidylethanolamine-hydrolysing phospholipase D